MEKIYQIRNSFWLADFYVFSKMEVDLSLYEKDSVTSYPYIKINPRNKIEETGSDIRQVFSNGIDEIIKKSSIANKAHRSVYKTIDMQYWGEAVSSSVLHHQDNQVHLVVGRRAGTGKSLFLKKVFDEHGYLRTDLYYVCKITEDGTRELTFDGTLFELSTCKYDPNSRYTLKNYQLDTVIDNRNGLEMKLKIKELMEHES